jgi:hypothetical protein
MERFEAGLCRCECAVLACASGIGSAICGLALLVFR